MSRTTRNKLRWQAEKIDEYLNKCQEHLQFLDELASGQSDYINNNLPVLVALFEEMRKTIASFRQGL